MLDCDLLPGGRLLFLQRCEEEDEITRYDIVLGWFDELRADVDRRGGATMTRPRGGVRGGAGMSVDSAPRVWRFLSFGRHR